MHRSCLIPRHEARGARLTGEPDAPRLLTDGDVPGEYRAAVEGCGVLDETDRGLVVATGAERAEFLHRLLANEVRGLEPGRGNATLLLTSKGKIVAGADLAVDAEEIRLSTRAGGAAPLAAALDMYHFTEDVAFEDATERYAPIALVGPKWRETLQAVLGEVPDVDDYGFATRELDGHPLRCVPMPIAGCAGVRLEATPELAPVLWDRVVEAGAKPVGLVARDGLRCEAAVAEHGVDVDDTIYPQEARLEAAFSLEKGCYVGQEVVAKIDTYGGLNKCTTVLAVSHDDPVAPGTRLVREIDGEDRDLGIVTSWGYSFALDRGVVLAYVKRKHHAVGTAFRLDGGDAEATIVQAPLRDGAVPITGGID